MKKILTRYFICLTIFHSYLLSPACADNAPTDPTARASYNAAVESALDAAQAAETNKASNTSTNNYWDYNQSVKYSVGKFGTSQESKTFEENSILQRNFTNADLSMTIPYVWQTGKITTTSSGAVIIRKTSINNGISGLGDITFDGNYYLLQEGNKAPLDLILTGYLKAPTASAAKGLGTGQWDGGPGIGFNKRLTAHIYATADVAYTFDGKSSGLEIKNQTSFDGGLEYVFSPNAVVLVKYDYASASVQGISQAEDIALSLDYKINNEWRINAEIARGLTTGTPDETYLLGTTIQFDDNTLRNFFSPLYQFMSND